MYVWYLVTWMEYLEGEYERIKFKAFFIDRALIDRENLTQSTKYNLNTNNQW